MREILAFTNLGCMFLFRKELRLDTTAILAKQSKCVVMVQSMLTCRYDNPAIALNCGSVLRDCVRDQSLARSARCIAHITETSAFL